MNWGPITTTIRHLERWRRILKYSECFLMLAEFVKSILVTPVSIIGWNNSGKDEVRYIWRNINFPDPSEMGKSNLLKGVAIRFS